jgi:hypothetical protein
MDAHSLMRKLMEIERALPVRDDSAIRNLILEAQNGLLQLERENEELALQNAGLRQRLRGIRNSALPRVAQSLNAAAAETFETPDFFADAPSCQGRCADHDSAPEDPEQPRTWRITHFFFS